MSKGMLKSRIAAMILTGLCLSMVIVQTACANVLPKEESALAVPLVTPAAIKYKTQPAALSSISNAVLLSGTVFPLTQQNLFFTYEQGRLQEMLVETGDVVAAGDVLATIDTEELDRQISLVKLDVERAWIYYSAAAEGSVEKSLASVELQKQKIIRDALLDQKEGSTIVAPFDGLVTYTDKTAVGELVHGYQTMVTIADPSTLMVVTEDAAATGLSVGGTAEISFKQQTAQAAVIETPTTIDPDAASAQSAYLAFTGEIPEVMKSGSKVSVDYVTEEKDDVIVLAKKYVIAANNRKYVNVLEDGLRVEKDVVVGISNETDVEIVSGLAVGDLVILN